MTLTDEQISRALDGTYLSGMFDYITIWDHNKPSIEVRPTPELRELAGLFHALGREAGLMEAAAICDQQHDRVRTSTGAARADACSKAILAAIPSPPNIGEGEQVCEWWEEDEGCWATSCGELWTFIDGGTEENRMKFCHGCGKRLKVKE